jgi:hypothetical protein
MTALLKNLIKQSSME